ncbi:hypothetical protein JSY14_07750 [Brachybacterium sp. EF45031]|uniref:hypothetical protein n=1 Tax=Brachybacterium sillae TaxID=2810536 RepID=UPI00217D2653|nr:hypothetical protein [Brachybacterium sillae]MCS6711914.1 hypothetical protein [Brachybacterium sillae]
MPLRPFARPLLESAVVALSALALAGCSEPDPDANWTPPPSTAAPSSSAPAAPAPAPSDGGGDSETAMLSEVGAQFGPLQVDDPLDSGDLEDLLQDEAPLPEDVRGSLEVLCSDRLSAVEGDESSACAVTPEDGPTVTWTVEASETDGGQELLVMNQGEEG